MKVFLSRLLLFVSLLAVFLFFGPQISAQSTNAALSGVVSDSSGSVIPKASVLIVNRDIGITRRLMAGTSGEYSAPALPSGNYRITVSAKGFETLVTEGVKLSVAESATLNFKLQVGSVSQSVTVNAASQNIETGGSISTVIDHTFIENMPLNGNNLSTLFELTPGVVTNASGGNPGSGGGLSVNGQQATSNYLTLDGASENIYVPLTAGTGATNVTGQGIPVSASGGTNGLLPTDAIEEYRLQTSTYSAEYGRTPGGQIGIKTRGGTNEFHGSVFENFRNQVMDATDYFVKFLGEKQPPLRMNDFGGTFGGAILKNKLFFFMAHETLLMRQPEPGYNVDVPSACAIATASSSFQPLLAAFPAGNRGPDTTQPLCESTAPYNQPISDIFDAAYSNPLKEHSTSIRFDANLPWRSRAFFRINDAPSDRVNESWNPTSYVTDILTTTGGITSQVTPRSTNDLTINFSRDVSRTGSYLTPYGGYNPSTFTSTLASILPNPASDTFYLDTFLWSYADVGPSQSNTLRQWNAVDSLSWTLGRHSVKIGIDYLWRNPELKPSSLFFQPLIEKFSSVQSGILDQLSYHQYYSNPDLTLTNLSLFAADTWRVNKALTLNYGLRWEINPPPSATGPGLFAIEGDITNPSTITEAPAGAPLYRTVYTNLAPRFGFAYSLRDNPRFATVIRGGLGIFFDTGSAATAAQAAELNYPYEGSGSMLNVPYSSIDYAQLQSSKPSLPQTSLYITDPHLQAPRTYDWSLTVDQNIGTSTTLSTSYVANDGQKLANTVEYYTGYGSTIYFQNPLLNGSSSAFYLATNGADSNYQSLQMQLRNRISQRLDVIASWTLAHNITDGVSAFSGPQSIAQYSGRADSSNDIRHIFSAAIHYSPQGLGENRFLKTLTEGWALDTVALLQSAAPLSVTANNPVTTAAEYNGLADVLPGVPVILKTNINPVTGAAVPGGKMLNPNAFSVPTCACNGNSIQNGYRLFGLTQWDLAVGRTWNIWEKSSFNFRVDAFNILNTANFADVQTYYASYELRTFGEAQNTYAGSYGGSFGSNALNGVFQNGGPRAIQLSAKIKF